jgi:hypothetical protein
MNQTNTHDHNNIITHHTLYTHCESLLPKNNSSNSILGLQKCKHLDEIYNTKKILVNIIDNCTRLLVDLIKHDDTHEQESNALISPTQN